MFIQIPFLIEGILQGAAGAVLAVIALFGIYYAFLYNAGNLIAFNPVEGGIIFLPPEYIASIFAGSITLGFLGSITSLKRFIVI